MVANGAYDDNGLIMANQSGFQWLAVLAKDGEWWQVMASDG